VQLRKGRIRQRDPGHVEQRSRLIDVKPEIVRAQLGQLTLQAQSAARH
jgi:hypothetical protein